MKITYQGIPCLRAEMNRSPGLSPGRGFAWILRSDLPAFLLAYNADGVVRGRSGMRWPQGAVPTAEPEQAGTPATPPSSDAVSFVGDLIFDSSDEAEGSKDNVVTFRRIYVDRTGLEEVDSDAYDTGGLGPIVKVNLVDSRVYWTTGGELTGRFNIVKPAGTADPASLKKGKEAWSYLDLLRLAIAALPSAPILAHVDDEANAVPPPCDTDWTPFAVPVAALGRLLSYGGMEIALHLDDTVGIYREGKTLGERVFVGAAAGQGARGTITVPATVVEKSSHTVRFSHVPALVRVWGGRRRVNIRQQLYPVFHDAQGRLRPLTDAALADAGFGWTLEKLAKRITLKPAGVPIIDPLEKRFLDDAFRLFAVASVSTGGPGNYVQDLDAWSNPLLPMLPWVGRNPAAGGRPVEQGFRVKAVSYYEQMFSDKKTLSQAIDAWAESIRLELRDVPERLRDLQSSIDKLAKEYKEMVAKEEARVVSTPGEAARIMEQRAAQFTDPVTGKLIPEAAEVVFGGGRTSPPLSDLVAKQSAAAVNLMQNLTEARKSLQAQSRQLESYLSTAESSRGDLLEHAEFRKFFKLSYTAGITEYAPGSYEVFPEKGLVKFNEPLLMLSRIASDDPDGAEAASVGDSWGELGYSYELKTDTGLDYVSLLFARDPAQADGISFEGRNVFCDAAPLAVRDDSLCEYLGVDGKTVDPAYDKSVEAAARSIAARELSGGRSQVGTKLVFAHFWPIEAAPPVSNLVIGSEGDVPRTFVAVEDPDEPLLGYPSLRQAREKSDAAIAALKEKRQKGGAW